MSGGTVVRVGDREISLSNLDKVLYPETGTTKGEAIEYYAKIAPVMVPHLTGRCITLKRFPNGVNTTGFFEKRCPKHRPAWIPTAVGPGDRDGDIGYCRFDEEEVAAVSAGFLRPGARTLLGEGVFIMTVDQGTDMDRYQGVTAIEGETLALCAEQYFAQSEQTPTRILLAVGQVDGAEHRQHWRAGGVLIQNIADDEARGSTTEAWSRTQILFETIGEDELVDPELSSNTLLWRLFHEDGVRVFGPQPLRAFCRCSQERIETVLRAFDPGERADMVEDDGKIRVTCEYCAHVYAVEPADLDAAA